MFQILHQYLIQHNSVSLPGLGTLVLQKIPAISNFTDHVVEPPMQKIVFDDLHDSPDKDMFQYVAARLKVEEWEAIKRVNDLSYELKNRLKQDGEIVWDKVGVLSAGLGGDINLDAKTITYDFMEPVSAIRIIRTDANHTILRGDSEVRENFIRHQTGADERVYPDDTAANNKRQNWWILAAILGGLALGLLALHLYREGFMLNSIYNIQKPAIKEAPSTYRQY